MEDLVYAVYIMTNFKNTTSYTGFSRGLKKRVWEHREKLVPGFSKKYNLTKLVYYETHDDYEAALAREKQIKAGSRVKKIQLIENINPSWKDLYDNLD